MFAERLGQNQQENSMLEESNISGGKEESQSQVNKNPAEVAYKNRFWIGLGKKLVKRGKF